MATGVMQSADGGSRRRGRRRRARPMSEINVTPFVDVMLVLLIIFMITAPLLTQGISVDLPQAASEPLDPYTSPRAFRGWRARDRLPAS